MTDKPTVTPLTEAGRKLHRELLRETGGDSDAWARTILAIEAEARQAERERLRELVKGLPGLDVEIKAKALLMTTKAPIEAKR